MGIQIWNPQLEVFFAHENEYHQKPRLVISYNNLCDFYKWSDDWNPDWKFVKNSYCAVQCFKCCPFWKMKVVKGSSSCIRNTIANFNRTHTTPFSPNSVPLYVKRNIENSIKTLVEFQNTANFWKTIDLNNLKIYIFLRILYVCKAFQSVANMTHKLFDSEKWRFLYPIVNYM